MTKKLPTAVRGLLSTAFLLLVAGLLNTTPVQSAPTAGILTVVNDLVQDNGGTLNFTDFEFSTNGGTDWTPFEGDGQNDLPVENGTYDIIGKAVTGYTTSYTNCTGVEILDDTAICEITYDDIQPQLTVIKNVINDNGGTLGSGDFTINVTGTNVSSSSFPGEISPGTTVTLNAGSYNVSETPVLGYESIATGDCSGTIAVGEQLTCTITNVDFARLTVVKDFIKNDGSALPDDFLLTVNDSPVLSGIATEYPIDTPLAINETLLVGYEFFAITGSGKCPAVLGGDVTLALGDDITCTIVNDNIPAIKAVPAGGLVTDENGTQDVFTVELTTIPSNPVTITVGSSDPTEATVDPVELIFLPGNWGTPQPVTVTGVGDMTVDGDKPYNIILDPSTSAAAEYTGLTPVQVSGTNFDTDTAGYIITPSTGLLTTEGGVTQKVTISLRSRPTDSVTLSIVSDDLTEGTVSTSSIIINPTVWPQPAKEFTITGVDDCLDDGDVDYGIVITATSPDSNYTGTVATLPVTNHDAPTIQWVSPVGNGESYYIDGLGPILLEVESICPEPISKVRFYRWVEPIGDWVTIGEDLTSPYQEIIYPSELEFEWNEVRAFAFGPPPALPGEIQTYSPHPFIFIYKGFGDERVYLPIVRK